MSTRPSTPYYFYSDPEAEIAPDDPPPSYFSSSSSSSSSSGPSSSVSSPRSSSHHHQQQQQQQQQHGLHDMSITPIIGRNGHHQHQAVPLSATAFDMSPLHSSSTTGAAAAAPAPTAGVGASGLVIGSAASGSTMTITHRGHHHNNNSRDHTRNSNGSVIVDANSIPSRPSSSLSRSSLSASLITDEGSSSSCFGSGSGSNGADERDDSNVMLRGGGGSRGGRGHYAASTASSGGIGSDEYSAETDGDGDGDEVVGESSAHALRFGAGGPLSSTAASVSSSSRAASPSLGASTNSCTSPSLSSSSASVSSPSTTTSASTSSAVHHHIHHHYHHASASGGSSKSSNSTGSLTSGIVIGSGSSSSSTAAAAGNATALSRTGSGTLLSSNPLSASSGGIAALTGLSALTSINGNPSGGGAGGSGKGKGKPKSDRKQLLSSDYDVPDDGYFFAGNGYHYRSGPLARKLGSTILSRDPSLTDLPLLSSTSSTAANTPNSAYSNASRRRAGWKSPRRSDQAFLGSDDFSSFSGSLSGAAGGGGSGSASSGNFNHPLLDGSAIPYRNRRRISAFVPVSIQKWWYRFLRHPLVPTQPLTILFALALFAAFAFSVTTFMYHILSTDKAPRPWRQYCQEQRPFPHELADSLAPVDVFVGVFSVDAAYERRHLIRSTYLRHSRPIDPHTGRPGQNVQVKFILGRPRSHHARRIALEMETYNDIVVLDMKENMNQGKTHAFFKWANENATVPIYYKAPHGAKRIGRLTPTSGETDSLTLGFKKADYVVKADDDSFLVLSELERHLRVAPRTNMYWGYLIRNLFMGGECYALSADLVNYVASYAPLEAYTTGAEDKRVAKWMRLHPNASSINWITERCYIYDHPKAATTYSHGFLFPDEVERVRAEGKTGISATERQRRGGELADAWSSVSKWKKAYIKPKKEMTIEEEVEALIEGGGRWTALDGWTNKISSKDVVQWDGIVFDSMDERIKGGIEKHKSADEARSQYNLRSEAAFGRYNRIPNSLLRDPGELDIRPQHAKRSWEFWKRDSLPEETLPSPSNSNSGNATTEDGGEKESDEDDGLPGGADDEPESEPSNPYQGGLRPDAGSQYPIGSSPNFKKGFSFLPDAPPNPDTLKQRAIPAPTLRYDPSTMTLRERRFLGLPYGGTVVVHYLKRNEWFLETALALLGRENFWDTGLDAPAYPRPVPPRPAGDRRTGGDDEQHDGDDQLKKPKSISTVPTWNGKGGEAEIVPAEWGSARMYGSPLVIDNGFVAMGRTVPWDALQKSEEGKYGRLKGSPRQRYVDIPGESDSDADASSVAGTPSSSLTGRDDSSSSSSSVGSGEGDKIHSLSSSSSSPLFGLSSSSSSPSSASEEDPSLFSGHPDLHTHSSSSSLLESHVADHPSSSQHHQHIQHSSSSSSSSIGSSSSHNSNGGLKIQDPAILNLA